MKKIKVAHIITRMIVGGAQENTLLTVQGLNKSKRYTATLITGDDRGLEGQLLTYKPNFAVIKIPELRRNINPVLDIIALVKLYKIIKVNHFDIVHTHSSKAGILGRLAARWAGTPIIIHTLHSLVIHDYQPKVVNWFWSKLKKLVEPFTDYFISVSQEIATKAVRLGIIPKNKISTIYSGMELDWFLNNKSNIKKVKLKYNIPENLIVIGMIARFTPLKGHEQLLNVAPKIVKKHPNIRFLLVGDGSLLDPIKLKVRQIGIDKNFIFTNLIPREQIPEIISVMDIVVHTSLREGIARVLPQALASGKPCVAYNIDGASEVVINGKTGYLVDPDNQSQLSKSLSKLIDDKNLRVKFGQNGKKLVKNMFKSEIMVNKIIKLYDELLSP